MPKNKVLILPSEPMVTLAAANATQALVAGALTKVNYDVVIYENNLTFDLVNNQFIIPVSGYWSVLVNNHFANVAGGGRLAEIKVNGVTVQTMGNTVLNILTYGYNQTVYREDYFNVGDVIEAYAYQNGGVIPLNVLLGMYSYISIKLINEV